MARPEPDAVHAQTPCTGVLLTNLGTPDAPTPDAVRRYLGEFLADPRVVELPRALWRPILHGVVLRTRPKRSAAAYAKIWTDAGSPLLAIAKRQTERLQAALDRALPGPVRVQLAMRYGQPSIRAGMQALAEAGARRILVFPLYPQYSASTGGSTMDAVNRVLSEWRWLPEIRSIMQYHDDPGYIEALAASVRAYWVEHGRSERLLMSFHGLPKRYLLAGDPYHCQCHKTGRLLAAALGLGDGDWQVTFQSRFGRAPWLQPYTDVTVRALGALGVKQLDVICPGFSADCLETLEEISLQNAGFFREAGGETLHYVPALNDTDGHIDVLTHIACRHLRGWPEADPAWDAGSVAEAARLARERARALERSGEGP